MMVSDSIITTLINKLQHIIPQTMIPKTIPSKIPMQPCIHFFNKR